MAGIRDNLNATRDLPRGEGRPGVMTSLNLAASRVLAADVRAGVASAAPAVSPASSPVPESPPAATPFLSPTIAAAAISPARAALAPSFQAAVSLSPTLTSTRPFPFPFPNLILARSTTEIARGAIGHLRGAEPAVVGEAVNTIRNKKIVAGNLMTYLERKVIIGQVLNDLAKDWTAETLGDFAEAFQMDRTRTPVMDAIVSIAILNDPKLKDELEAENTSEPTQADFLENRKIVWQYPPPGTPLSPPYIVLVAFESRDTTQANEVIQSILGDLVDFQGFKLPKDVVQRLAG